MRWIILCLTVFMGCKQMDTKTLKGELLQVDREFSQMSVEEGTIKAFEFYMADDGMVLPQQGHPRDKEYYSELLQRMQNNRDSVLNWEPIRSDVSDTGDLGYTHGRYTMSFADTAQAPKYGYYVTIWKRQANGAWKFVFDAGNLVESFSD